MPHPHDTNPILDQNFQPNLPPLPPQQYGFNENMNNPTDELNLAPQAAGLPGLPPLPQPEAGGGGGADPQDPMIPTLPPPDNDIKTEEQPEAEMPDIKPFELTKSYKTTLQLKTDLSKLVREDHPCGILHFTRQTGMTEEHAFAWIAHHDNPAHLTNALKHFEKFGFDSESVTFIPYSSRRSWIEKYPLAFPHVHCGENGHVMGYPYWSGGIAGRHSVAGRMNPIAAASLSGADVGADATASPSKPVSTPVAAQRGRKKKKIIPTAHLPNEEREELHIEIYKYFQWLHTSLSTIPELQAQDNDKKKKRSSSSAAGINLAALQKLMETMQSTFKVVRNAQPAIAAAAAASANNSSLLPLLEDVLGEQLAKLVDVARKDPEVKSARKQRSRGHDFEDMFERLLQFQREHGHVNVAQKYAQDGQLGSWVANIRSKRKQMAKRGEEFELDVPVNNENEEEDEEKSDEEEENEGGEEGGEGGTRPRKKRKKVAGRQRLTRERIHRLDSIGFQWIVANPNSKSWEERFEDLKEYQQMHGTTRVPRSSGTLGEWVHMQRRLHNKKDPNFMARRAPLLDDIGFEWHPRKHALVSWDDNFNRLIEFGRINRHYNVQSPFPDGYLGDHDGEQDPELVEAHRFHKWVRRIHAEYRAYASGKMSRMLNDARVMQLREIGFQFSM